MSSQLARRTGTVSALVAAASVTMVAGCWPALAADAPDQRPGRVASAPGQQDKAPAPAQDTVVSEPVAAEPVVEPVVTEPVAAESVVEPVVTEPVVEPVVEPDPVASEPVVTEPVVSEPAPRPGRSGSAPGQVAKLPVADATASAPVAQEPAATAPQDSAAGQPEPAGPGQEQKSTAPGQEKKDTAAPAPVVGPPTGAPSPVVGPPTGVTAPTKAPGQAQAPKAPAPKAERPAAPAPVAAPVAGPPAAPPAPAPQAEAPVRPVVGPPTSVAGEPQGPAGPVAQPRTAPVVVGPPVPVAAPSSDVLSGGLTLAAPAGRRALGAAADPWPLRPTGSTGLIRLAAPAVQGPALAQAAPRALPRRPEALQVDLGTALPALASGTVEAVASKPQIPVGIAVVVVAFLLLQSRIDRRDPKLALVRLEDDAPLDFEPTEAVLGARQLVAVS